VESDIMSGRKITYSRLCFLMCHSKGQKRLVFSEILMSRPHGALAFALPVPGPQCICSVFRFFWPFTHAYYTFTQITSFATKVSLLYSWGLGHWMRKRNKCNLYYHKGATITFQPIWKPRSSRLPDEKSNFQNLSDPV